MIACAFSLVAQSPSPAGAPAVVSIQLLDADLADVLHFYATLSKRKVWIELGVSAKKISIFTKRPTPPAEALAFVRGTLLADHNIDIREVGDDEAFVSRKLNPVTERLLPRPSPLSSPSFSPSLLPALPRVRGVITSSSSK